MRIAGVLRAFSYSNVMATLALFVAIGGTSYAAVTLTGANIKDGTVQSVDIADGLYGVQSRDVKDGSLGAKDLSAAARATLKGNVGATGAPGPTGLTGPTGPGATKLVYHVIQPVGAAPDTTTLATVGAFTFRGRCTAPVFQSTNVELTIEGGSGQAFVYQSGAYSDVEGADAHPYLRQAYISGQTVIGGPQTSVNSQTASVGRDAGTVMVEDGSTLLQVTYYTKIDQSPNFPGTTPRCLIIGSVIQTS